MREVRTLGVLGRLIVTWPYFKKRLQLVNVAGVPEMGVLTSPFCVERILRELDVWVRNMGIHDRMVSIRRYLRF